MFDSIDSESPQVTVSTNKSNNINQPLESISTDDFYGSDERFLEIHISFKLPNGTAEFPTVCYLLPIGCFFLIPFHFVL